MIFDLPNTSTREIAKQLSRIRDMGAQVTTGRVLTLIVIADKDQSIDEVMRVTTDATREHPARILILTAEPNSAENRLDADVRIGGDAGASEIINMHFYGELAQQRAAVVTPLLLPDTPIVSWWPRTAPLDPSSVPLGAIAQRRITDALNDPGDGALALRRSNYTPGDSDLAWSRITQWRGVVATCLDGPQTDPVAQAIVAGPVNDPSVDLAAAWLADRLGITVSRKEADTLRAQLIRNVDKIELEVVDDHTLRVCMPGRKPALVALNRPTTADCLSEELSHLEADSAYARTLRALNKVRYQ
ncbi:MAG: glucose-6-phosphate dehydrogenase assembly protein OpcA [Corynebacterium sp.]|nr:glucose-6-phosphate dehydrogenase assembly protein OpcA [Corynebacterium sp.]